MTGTNITTKTSLEKPKRPPPLQLHDRHDHRLLTKLIIDNIGTNFNIRYIRDSTVIQTDTAEQHKILVEAFKSKQFNFHTYTDKNERLKSVVIKGLSSDTTEEDIKSNLEKRNIQVIRCNKMRTRHPTFLVSVKQETPLEEITKINSIDHTRVHWENYVSERRITQCHVCQMWGHATNNCHARPKCLKCAGSHSTRECTKTNETPARCVNCGGAHPASATVCPKFIERQQYLNRMRDERQLQARRPNQYQAAPREFPPIRSRYVPAPLPTENPWFASRQRPEPAPIAAAATPPAMAATTKGTFGEMAAEMGRLRSLVDIDKVLKLLRELNSKLENVQNPQQKIQITFEFLLNLSY